MSKHLTTFATALLLVLALAVPASAIEGASERASRKAREAIDAAPKGDLALDAKNYDAAIGHYTKAIDGKGFSGEELGRIYYKRGIAYQAKGDCTNALADYGKALETVTNNGELLFNRSLCHEKTQQSDAALEDLNAAIKINPESAIYRVARCLNLFNRKNFAGAIPDCEAALASAPEDKTMLLAVSQSYEQTGDKAKAADAYRRLLKLDPANATASEGLKRTGG